MCAVVLGLGTLFAQEQPPKPSFEVARVKLAASSRGGGPLIAVDTDPAMVRYANITLKNLIAIAYQFDSRRIRGGPAWLDNELYEVAAKLPLETSKDRVPLMLQTLLTESFRLVVRRETRPESVYFLVIGKNGSKLKETAPESTDTHQIRGRAPIQILPGRLTGHAVTVSAIASSLALAAGKDVMEHTQLTGTFDFDLRWTPENSSGDAPDLFTAVQEQLGLRLEPKKAPVEILVVDHAERIPVEN